MNPAPDSTLDDPQQVIADLQRQLTERSAERDEALEQQTATAEVLGVINDSPGDLAPVFDAMLQRGMRLCEAAFGGLVLWQSGRWEVAAQSENVAQPFLQFLAGDAISPGPREGLAHVARNEGYVQIPDITVSKLYHYQAGDPTLCAMADLGGGRTALTVPLAKDDEVLGIFSFYRQEVRPFSERQISLVRNFATQAVIAMENARLLGELRQRTADLEESLEYQTATSDVLKVISHSTFDLQPVFETIVTTAARLCDADTANIGYREDKGVRIAATFAASPEFDAFFQGRLISVDRGSVVGRTALAGQLVHVADIASDPEYNMFEAITLGKYRTTLGVPLLREGVVIGVITLARGRVQPFTDQQIDLVRTFADQAVIAIENARLITETREALEQQTATAEVLGVINSSPGDLAPVFDAILEKARTLCGAAFGTLMVRDGARFHAAALHNVPERFAEVVSRGFEPHPDSPIGRLVVGDPLIHLPDLRELAAHVPDDPVPQAAVEFGGIRTLLMVPLRKEENLLGVIVGFRQEIRPFIDKQIALLQNFAAQAVIAMENARLITETREALEQQTATADILGVISGSPSDVQPTFDAIAARANVLCDATSDGVFRFDGSHIHLVAHNGWTPAEFEAIRGTFPLLPGKGSVTARAILTRQVAHVHDIAEDPDYSAMSIARSGLRTVLSVPMLRDGQPIGAITVDRREVRPFSENEIGLLKTFAAQAVIAIENVRLFDELRQRQAELRATFDNMGDGVVMFDERLRLAAWNRNFQEMLDLPDTILAERPDYSDYLRILAERGEFGTEDIEAELSRRLEHMDQEFRRERTRPDGRVIEVRRNAVPDGGFVLIYSDITERKRSEAEIRAARDAAEAAYHDLKAAQANLIQVQKMAALGQLTAGIAHEIKNPLNFVNNFAGLSVELLDELKETAAPAIETLDEDTRADLDDTIDMLTGNLEKIVEHGQRADNIVKSMLEHSRGVTSERRKVDLNNLVEEALNLTYHGARAQDQSFNITLQRDYDKDLTEIEIVPQEVNRVFINLIGNGFYAAAKRQRDNGEAGFRPVLKVSTRDLGEAIEVRIRDNGIGIPADIRDKLFQPFFTTKPTGEGTGLGLSISYDIVTQQHGGTIEVDSELGQFTEFTVRLPRRNN